jgi:hypothetical protein
MKTVILIIGMLVLSSFANLDNYNPKDISTKNVHTVYTIKVEDKEKNFDWDQYIKIEQIIPLETNSNSVFANPDKVYVLKDKMFFKDRKNQSLKVFDIAGKFLFDVGNKGKGPEEYLEVRDFMITDNNIYILDYKKIHCFDASNGKFKSNFNITTQEMSPICFLVFDSNDYYLWQSNPSQKNARDTKFRLLKFEEGKLKSRYFKYDHFSNDMNRFFKRPDGSFFMRPIDGEYDIYKITKDSVSLSFVLNFDNKNLPKDYFTKNPININNEYLKTDYYKSIADIFETEDYIYFTCAGPQSYAYEGLINKKTNQVSFGKRDFSSNPRIIYSDGKYLYGYYQPSLILNEPIKKIQHYFFDEIKNRLKDIKVEDNIILVKYSLKVN